MPKPFRRASQEADLVDLDDALAAYEVTRAVAAEPSRTGLPEPAARRRPVEPDPAPEGDASAEEPADADEVAVAGAGTAGLPLPPPPPPPPSPDSVLLHLGESVDLEVVDLDGTGYLFRGVVINADETPQLAISSRTADELQGWEVLTSGAQVVAVVQREDESWLLTSRIVGTSWVEAAAVVDLQPLRRALSTGRRVHQRVARSYRVALPADIHSTRATTVDLSPGGAAIEVAGAGDPPTGSFEVVLLMPDPVSLRAVVNGSRAGSTPDSRIWHAQFVVVPSAARQRLLQVTS
jgi:hypothetical protein